MSCKVNGRFFKFAFAALCFAGSLIFVRAEKSPKIVIVGAGAAGIAAATELVQQNFDVTILEAAGRIGGRIHTHKFGTLEDLKTQIWYQNQFPIFRILYL